MMSASLMAARYSCQPSPSGPGRRLVGSCQQARASSAGWRVEQVDDVALLAPAELDADGVDQNQAVQLGATVNGDLGREPAAEGEADKGDPIVGSWSTSACRDGRGRRGSQDDRAARGAEAGVGGGEDRCGLAEAVEEGGVRR